MKPIIVKDLNDYYRKVGKFLGYPECCTEAFIKVSRLHLELKIEKVRLITGKSSGFLPCLKHAKMIEKGKITLESLIKNRKVKEPFPILSIEELGKYFILNINKGYVVTKNNRL
jgi:hypothetical protein